MKNDSKRNRIQCYISDSVKNEINTKIVTTTNYLGNVVRQMIQYALVESRRNRGRNLATPMDSEDIRVLEDLFASFHQTIRQTNISLITPISVIEEWIISFLAEKFDKRVPIDISQFILELTMKLLEFTGDMQNGYDDLIEFQNGYIKTENIVPDPSIITVLSRIGLHQPDNIHVASAYFHQINNSEQVVFVTFDHRTILRKRYDIWNNHIHIKCSDPLYALHHIS